MNPPASFTTATSSPVDELDLPEIATIGTEEELRAIASPERLRILSILIERSGTAKEVAEWVSGTRGRIHYHIKELEKVGLISLVPVADDDPNPEKRYRAKARNFVLARGIGAHQTLSDDLHRMVASSMRDWRREEVLGVDRRRVADRIVRDSLQISPGHLVIILPGFESAEVVAAFHQSILAAGGECLVRYPGAGLRAFLLEMRDKLDAIIAFDTPLSDHALPAQSPGETRSQFVARLADSAADFAHASAPGDPIGVTRELMQAGIRIVHFGYPTQQRAQLLRTDFDTLHDVCWTALDLDYDALSQQCTDIAARIRHGREIEVRSPGGTDLKVRVDQPEFYIDDGIIETWEVDAGRGYNQLPAGKVMFAPAPGSVEGTLHSEVTDYLGVSIRGVRLVIRGNEVVHATADENEDLLRAILQRPQPNVRTISGFSIGANPKIREPIGYAAWDCMVAGEVHVWLGRNRDIGGDVESDFAWSLGIRLPKVSIDGHVLVESGQFLL